MTAFRETLAALRHWPDKADWAMAIRLAGPALAIMAAIGFLGGWLYWHPQERWQEIVKTVFYGLFFAALPAEIIFRGFLLSFIHKITPRWAAWISTLLFVLFFPVYGWFHQTKWNGFLLLPSFWFAMLIFGIILSHIRIRSGSLWPGILIYWFAISICEILLGWRYY